MFNPNEGYFEEDNSWFECIGDIDLKTLENEDDMLDV